MALVRSATPVDGIPNSNLTTRAPNQQSSLWISSNVVGEWWRPGP